MEVSVSVQPKTVVCVEDTPFAALTIRGMFQKAFPEIDLRLVSDAENAQRVLLGEPFFRWEPDCNWEIYIQQRAVAVWGVIWDNQFPEFPGGRPVEDMGILTAGAIAASGKVSREVLSRFAVSSADPPEKFSCSGIFSKIVPKPITARQLKSLMSDWGHRPEGGI